MKVQIKFTTHKKIDKYQSSPLFLSTADCTNFKELIPTAIKVNKVSTNKKTTVYVETSNSPN